MATPTPPPTHSGVRRHPRGVTLDEHPPAGHVVINVYGLCGERVMTELCHVTWYDDEIEAEMWTSLEKRCPEEANTWCASCPLVPRSS